MFRTFLLTAILTIVFIGPAALGEDRADCDFVAPVVVESDGVVSFNFGPYRAEFSRRSGRLDLYRGSSPIAASPAAGSFLSLSDGGELKALSGLSGWEIADGVVRLVFAQVQGGEVRLELRGFRDRLEVRLDSRESRPEAVEFALELAGSGHWYGGNVTSGHHWPLETGEIELDPYLASSNQNSPFFLTSAGFGFLSRTYERVGLAINRGGDGVFRFRWRVPGEVRFELIIGRDIVGVYRSFIELVGKPAVVPPKEYFTDPIFNTWIEFMVDVDQAAVLSYAGKIREIGFPCAILDIDDRWQRAYGDHEFDLKKFPNPQAMVDQIHALGFKLALWVVPFIHTDAHNFKTGEAKGYLVMDASGEKPAMVRWWNGRAALVDLSNPEAYNWFLDDMKAVRDKYGIDGFKLDGGDAQYFRPEFKTHGNITPNRYTDLFASLGAHFDINEYRVSWLVQSLGLVQRLRDKNADWGVRSGLGSLVPHGLTESMIGYAFFCPDMIGGGLSSDFSDRKFKGMDPELFVRWTEASSLMPMMQFSYAPWNLDPESVDICLRYARLHKDMGDYIYRLAREAAETGRPIVRPLFFEFPDDETAYLIGDQFLLGNRFLVAPVTEKGARSRKVYLPSGSWMDRWTGEVITGPKMLEDYPAPLDRLPVFIRL